MSDYLDWQNKASSDFRIVPLLYVADYRISPVNKIIEDGEEPVKLCNYTDVYKNSYITSDITFMDGSASENEIERFQIEDGDVLITKDSEAWNDIGVPAIVKGDFEHSTICGYHLALIRPNKNVVIPKYLFYCFESKQHRLQLEIEATGVTRFGIPKSAIGKYKIPLPIIVRQQQIVDYLDKELAKIDALIEKKTQLLSILEEKKKAIINHAITKGLDPNVPMKDSRIEWLEEIPTHWELVKLKYVVNLKSGDFLSAEQIKEEGDFKVFGGNGQRGYVANYNQEGDRVLIGRQGALCGNINLANGKFWATEHAIVCNPITQFDYFWLAKQLELMNLNQYSLAAAQPGLSVDVIKNLFIVFPPIDEQKIISDYLLKYDKADFSVTRKITTSISLLKEKRAAIISAAINGELNSSLS